MEKDRKGLGNCNCDVEIPNEISVIVVKKKKGDCVDRRYVSFVILCAQIDWVAMKMEGLVQSIVWASISYSCNYYVYFNTDSFENRNIRLDT